MNKLELPDNNWFYIYAAIIAGEMVAYVNAAIIPKPDPRKGVLFVDELWTAPECRGLGIGTQLMKRVVGLGKELDLWRVRLYVERDNTAGRHVYSKVGFVETTDNVFCELDLRKVKGYKVNGF